MGFRDGVAEGEREREDFTVGFPRPRKKTLSEPLNFFLFVSFFCKCMCEMQLEMNANKLFGNRSAPQVVCLFS